MSVLLIFKGCLRGQGSAVNLFFRFLAQAFGRLLIHKKSGELNQGLPPEKTSGSLIFC